MFCYEKYILFVLFIGCALPGAGLVSLSDITISKIRLCLCEHDIWSKHIDISPYHGIFDSAAASLQKYETLALLPPPVFWQWHTAHGQCKMPTYTWTHEDSRDKVCGCCGIRTPKKKRYIVKPASTIYATFVRISLMLSYLILSH